MNEIFDAKLSREEIRQKLLDLYKERNEDKIHDFGFHLRLELFAECDADIIYELNQKIHS